MSLLGDGIELMVDGSEIFTVPTASLVAAALADLGVAWFEEPLPQPTTPASTQLARRSPVPIAYGEHLYGVAEALDALTSGQLLVLQPDASTCGGIGEARRDGDRRRRFGVRVVPHVCAGPISLAANLHVAATVPAITLIEYPPTLAGVVGRGSATAPRSESTPSTTARSPCPARPGLGVALDEAAAPASPLPPARDPRRRHRSAGSPTASSATADAPSSTDHDMASSTMTAAFDGPIGPSMAEFSAEYMTHIEPHLDRRPDVGPRPDPRPAALDPRR